MKLTQRILDYWYNIEFFSPYWPELMQDTIYINKKNKRIVWVSNANPNYTYDVYLGKIKSQDLIVEMLNAIGEEDDMVEKDSSQSCLCAFKLTSEGKYIEGSFGISTFVWALAKIISEKNLRIALNNEEIEKLNIELNDYLVSMNKKLEYNDLEKIYSFVMQKVQLKLVNTPFNAVINKKFTKKENIKSDSETSQGNEEDNKEASTDMMRSFYISDIDMVKQHVRTGDRIIQYIEALNNNTVNRIEIDHDIPNMEKWLSIGKYPLGKWPSQHSPSLMQQLAINIAVSGKEHFAKMFSVNGPPGTGKTTLLKEIIASNVVERALLLSGYQKPDDAFQRCQFDYQESNYLKNFYQPDKKIKKYGIIVASNNNAAVENISKELPLAKGLKKTNTNLFNVDENEEIYFTELSKALLGNNEECWGLISARLGKKSNINELKQTLWFNKEIVNLQQLYKGELPDWDEAKKDFTRKYEEVLKYREKIKIIEMRTKQHKKIMEEVKVLKDEVLKAKQNIVEQEKIIKQKVKQKIDLKNEIGMLTENEKELKNRIPFYKKTLLFFFRKDVVISNLKKAEQRLNEAIIKLTEINEELNHSESQLDNLKDNYEKAQHILNKKDKELQKSKQLMKQYKEHFGRNFADDEFWVDIQNNESSQLAAPWTDKTFDKLREELFYYGLILQKAFVLNSKGVKQNMNCLINMWNGSFTEKDKAIGYSHLLNTLFLIIPVISTTFASVSTFLKHINKDDLGTLIIDEAGQATPHSALGAIWRTSKAIIVGDPLQVEPVVTVPKEILRRFADEFEIEAEYRSKELSVQILADSLNPYGGYREYLNDKLWLGCPLVIHRRCLDPMFSISNKIAYNNRMFQQTEKPKEGTSLLLDKSKWIDIKGFENGGKDHFVAEQGDKVIEMVLKAFDLQKGFPSLFIISPFKSVINNLKKQLKKSLYNKYGNSNNEAIDNWVNTSCGTVHTFQGKEAHEVLFVLGCDAKSGMGAAQWAGKNPNILNVAVTRAKYRVAIIGDSDLWRRVSNFDIAYKALCR